MAEVKEDVKVEEGAEGKEATPGEGDGEGTAVVEAPPAKQSIAERRSAEKAAEEDAPVSEEERVENLSHLSKIVDQYPGLAQDPEFKQLSELRAKAAKVKEGEEKKVGEEGAEKKEDPEKKEGEEGGEKKAEEKKEEEKKEEEGKGKGGAGDAESTFFNKSQKGQDVKIASEDEAKVYSKDTYAIEIKNPEDWGKLFKAANGWRTDSGQHAELKDQYEGLTNELAQLPQPIYDAIKEYGMGGDWKKAFGDSTGKLDLSKNFDFHSKADVMKSYFPDEMNEINANTELEAEDKQKQIDKYHNSAQRLYIRDQELFEDQRATAVEQQEQRSATAKTSVDSSVNKLREDYPGFSDDMLKKVKSHLANGTLMSLFIDKAGSYKEDAAKSLAFALFGEEELQRKIEKVKRDTKSKTTEDVVSRKNEEPPKKGSQEQPAGGEAKETVKKYSSVFESVGDPYENKAD